MLMAICQEIQDHGFAQASDILTAGEVAAILGALGGHAEFAAGAAGLRNITELVPETLDVLQVQAIASPVVEVLGESARLVRAILFDKTPAKNWNVLWHQDLFIATRTLGDAPDFASWTTKDGVPHVRPSIAVLQQMLIVRIHLDACGSESGPLLVVPSTHALGMIDDETRQRAIADGPVVECTGPAGSAVFMRPLLLHSSRQATNPSRRRVLHLEFAAGELPNGIEWHLDVKLEQHRTRACA